MRDYSVVFIIFFIALLRNLSLPHYPLLSLILTLRLPISIFLPLHLPQSLSTIKPFHSVFPSHALHLFTFLPLHTYPICFVRKSHDLHSQFSISMPEMVKVGVTTAVAKVRRKPFYQSFSHDFRLRLCICPFQSCFFSISLSINLSVTFPLSLSLSLPLLTD